MTYQIRRVTNDKPLTLKSRSKNDFPEKRGKISRWPKASPEQQSYSHRSPEKKLLRDGEIPSSPPQVNQAQKASDQKISFFFSLGFSEKAKPKAMEEEDGVSKLAAVTACTAMALLYVAILYAPTLILRLPPPPSVKAFMIRRFVCAAVSSILSLLVSGLILPVSSNPSHKYVFASEKIAELKFSECWIRCQIRSSEASILFGVYGIRADHIVSIVI